MRIKQTILKFNMYNQLNIAKQMKKSINPIYGKRNRRIFSSETYGQQIFDVTAVYLNAENNLCIPTSKNDRYQRILTKQEEIQYRQYQQRERKKKINKNQILKNQNKQEQKITGIILSNKSKQISQIGIQSNIHVNRQNDKRYNPQLEKIDESASNRQMSRFDKNEKDNNGDFFKKYQPKAQKRQWQQQTFQILNVKKQDYISSKSQQLQHEKLQISQIRDHQSSIELIEIQPNSEVPQLSSLIRNYEKISSKKNSTEHSLQLNSLKKRIQKNQNDKIDNFQENKVTFIDKYNSKPKNEFRENIMMKLERENNYLKILAKQDKQTITKLQRENRKMNEQLSSIKNQKIDMEKSLQSELNLTKIQRQTLSKALQISQHQLRKEKNKRQQLQRNFKLYRQSLNLWMKNFPTPQIQLE